MIRLILLIILIPSVLLASDVTLEWDANSEPDISGYRLYQSTVPGSYGAPILDILHTMKTGMVAGITDGTYYWVVTAYDQSDKESGYSNEVSLTLVSGIPGEPQNLRIIIINESP